MRLIFRGILVALLVGLTWLAWRAWQWLNPENLRQQALQVLAARFPDWEITVEGAQLHGWGQLVLEGIRLYPREPASGASGLEIGRMVVRLDRLALAKGEVVPLEIVLQQFQVHIHRQQDGRWQYPPIFRNSPGDGNNLVALRIERAAVNFEDDIHSERARWEIADGQLIREASGWRFQVRGSLSWGGQLSAQGTWTPKTGQTVSDGTDLTDCLELDWQLENIPLQPEWQARLARWTGIAELQQLQMTGWLCVRGSWKSKPASAECWPPLEIELRDVKVEHPRLPEPIYALSGRLRLESGQAMLETLQGQWLGATLVAKGAWRGLDAQADGELEGTLQPLRIGPALYDKLPPALAKTCREFAAEGPVQLQLHWRRQAGQTQLHILANLQGLSFAFEDFPYPITQATGKLEYREVGTKSPLLRVDVTGLASGRKVQLHGEAFGPGLRPETPWHCGLRLDLDTEDVPINEILLKALPPRTQILAREFRPRGWVKVHAEIRRPAGTAEQPFPPIHTHIEAHIHQGQICYQRLPYPLEQVQGILEIDLPAETWRAVGFSAKHKDGLLFANAHGTPTPRGEKIGLTIQGQQVLLDEELRKALPEKMRQIWDEIRPGGRADFLAHLQWVGEQPPELDLTMSARGQCYIQPRFLPYRLEELHGALRYTNGQIVFGPFSARHGESRIYLGRDQLGGLLRLSEGGGWKLDLYQVRGDLLYIDKDLLVALPEGLRQVVATLQPDRPLRIVFDLQADSPRGQQVQSIRWDGHASFARCTWQCGIPLREATGYIALQGLWQGDRLEAKGQVQLQQVSVFRLPLRDVTSEIQIREGAVYLPGVRAKLFDGQVFGPIRYDYQPRQGFRLDLTVAQVDLQALARQSLGRQGKAQGKINARLILSGQAGDWRTLQGRGNLSITDGNIYDVPPFFNLLSLLAGQLPRDAAFQEVQTRFTIEGSRVHFSRVELLGDALTLRGQGSMRVDGSDLDLEMYALLWGRSLPLLPPGIDRIPPLISRQLWKIHMRGSLEQVVVTREPVPLVTDTLRLLWQLGPGRLQDFDQ